MYLNEAAAVEAIKSVLERYEEHTNDFKLFPFKRKANGTKKVNVIFVLKVKNISENEVLFNEFMTKSISEDGFQILESELDFENKVLKEAFFIECEISIFGI